MSEEMHKSEEKKYSEVRAEEAKKDTVDGVSVRTDHGSVQYDATFNAKVVPFDHVNGFTNEEANAGQTPRNTVRDVLSVLNRMKGRKEVGTYDSDNLFINHTRHHVPKKLLVIDYEMQLREADLNGPPRIRAVWLNQLQNMELHHTTSFSLTGYHNNCSVKQLIVRRGLPFCIDLSFDQPFNVNKHSLTIILQFGTNNVCSSPSMVCLKLNDGLKPNTWSAGFPKKAFHSARLARQQAEEEEKDDEEKKKELARANLLNANKVQVQINSPTNAVIGKCMLTFDTALIPKSKRTAKKSFPSVRKTELQAGDNTKTDAASGTLEDEEEVVIMRNFLQEPIYILCNPWKKEDQTYMEDEKELAEYVENQVGWIYMGTHKQLKAIHWNFDQFHNTTLNTVFYILESASLSVDVRSDVSLIVRAISKSLTSMDQSGVLSGNWSGSYSPELGPSQWLGTLPILEKFMASKKPVCYAHCYVFAAVATSLCRCLGIPTRCVTNYISAHDCDGHKKINLHWGSLGEPIDDLNTSNFWTFHVWCESYMKRPDLPLNSYDGWQAFDPTPQESCLGVVCAGPCPVEAVKQGDLISLYDCRLLFSEVHAHHFHWIVMDNGNWRVVLQPRRAGCRILTHDPSPKKLTHKDLCSPAAEEIKLEALNIRGDYKYQEGLVLERVAMERASTNAINSDVFDLGDGDVNFAVCQGDLKAGKIIGVSLVMQNTGTEERLIDITLSLYTSYYTGISKRKIKAESYTVALGPLSKQRVSLRATVEEYCWYTADYYNFKTYATAQVQLTKQIFCTCEDFCLEFPDIEFELANSTAIVNEETTIVLKWSNPLPIGLSNCMWTVQAHTLLPFTIHPAELASNDATIYLCDVEPLSCAQLQVTIEPKEIRELTLLANFSSDRSPFVRGRLDISVREPMENKSGWNA